MTPEEAQALMKRVEDLEYRLNEFARPSTYTFERSIRGGTAGLQLGEKSTNKIGFFGVTPIIQPSSAGETTGFNSTAGTTVRHQDTWYGGGVGYLTTAYTINDIVKHLKDLGILAN